VNFFLKHSVVKYISLINSMVWCSRV